MTVDAGTPAGSPCAARWDFGDFPYALEPLTLPPVGAARAWPGVAPEAVERCDVDRLLRDVGELAADDPFSRGDCDDALARIRAASPEQVFWFRWITGHQLAFLLWHLMGRLLGARPDAGIPDRPVLEKLATCTYGYCALLLYTGSCPPDLYTRLIRSRMHLQHPGFSGLWAPDFPPVRSLLRGRDLPWLKQPRAAGLSCAVELSKTVHDGVAARLVPSGRSLLQAAAASTSVRPSRRTAVLYDNFFLTLRAPLTPDGFRAQVFRRLRAVALDIAATGLHPLPDTPEQDLPKELCHDDVRHCEKQMGDILWRIGVVAAGEDVEHRP